MKIVVFGNGAIAELADYYFTHDSPHEVVAFAVDRAYLKEDTFAGRPLVAFEDVERHYAPGDHSMFIALGYAGLNRVRQGKYEAAKAKGYAMVSYVSSRLVSFANVEIGDNCFILENQTIQPFCRIGDNVTLWSGNHIGHHSTIGSHTFFASHIVVSGNCTIGERCFVGVNAAMRDSCQVGDESFIGMGAIVTKNVPAGAVVATEGSEIYPPEDRRARALKKAYFKI